MVLNDANILALRLLRAPQCSLVIHDYAVPVLTRPRETVMRIDFDLALVQVVPHIDGIKFVKLISLDAGVDIDIVQHCLRALYTYGFVSFVDIFQYSNTYTLISKVRCVRQFMVLLNEPPPNCVCMYPSCTGVSEVFGEF